MGNASLTISWWLPILAALTGALCAAIGGAIGTYFNAKWKDERDEDNRRHSALITTQYALFTQWTVLEDMRRHLLDPVREDEEHRHLNQKYYLPVRGEMMVPIDQLGFLIESDSPNLWQEIHIAQKRFIGSMNLLDRLNNIRMRIQEKYPPQTFNPKTGIGTMTTPVHEIFVLREASNLLYNEVDKSLPSLRKAMTSIFEFAKRNFKPRKAIKFEDVQGERAVQAEKQKPALTQ